VLLIDFKRSEILKQVPVLQESSPNQKRKHLQFTNRALRSGLPVTQLFIDSIGYQTQNIG
jgi:hypothetical protein